MKLFWILHTLLVYIVDNKCGDCKIIPHLLRIVLHRFDDDVIDVDARCRDQAPSQRIQRIGAVHPVEGGVRRDADVLAGHHRRIRFARLHVAGGMWEGKRKMG